MPEGSLKILISAGLDRNVETTFGSLEKMADRTARNVSKKFGGGTFKGFATDADKAAKSAEASFARQAKAAEKSLKDEHRAFDRAARDKIRLLERGERDQARILGQETRNAEREAEKQVKAAESAAKKIDAERKKFASRASGRAVKFMFPNPTGVFGMASRIGGDLMRGAGVDLNIGSSVSRVVDMSSHISQLQNQAAMNGQNVSHAELEGSVKGASDKYGFSRGDTAEALSKYIDKTGDAATGMLVLGKMAERAAASGGSIADMMDAAGDVALNLGPVKDKAKALTGVMDAMTVQGAKGAIEIKNLASSGMSRIASSAGRYEGDSGQNMVKLGALAQLARQSGGAASPAEAANAVSRLTDQLITPARAKQFSARGIDVMSKTEHGQLRDPIAIIREALLKTNGDPEALKKMFASTVGAKPVLALSKEFNAAGGGQAGLAAVDKIIASFMDAADIQKKLDEANGRRNEETATKTQKFQNSLDDVTEKMAGELLPTLEQLKQPALDVANAFGRLVQFAAQNPGEAVAVGILAAVGRSITETAFRGALEKALVGGLKIPGGVTMSVAGTIAIASAIVAITEAQKLAKVVGSNENPADLLPGFKDGKFSTDNLFDDILHPIKATDRRVKVAGDLGAHTYLALGEKPSEAGTTEDWDRQHPSGHPGRKLPASWDLPTPRYDYGPAPKHPDSVLKLDHHELANSVSSGMRRGGPLIVHVQNMPTDFGPTVDGTGRQPPPGGRHGGGKR